MTTEARGGVINQFLETFKESSHDRDPGRSREASPENYEFVHKDALTMHGHAQVIAKFINFSRALALLMASSGKAASTSFLFTIMLSLVRLRWLLRSHQQLSEVVVYTCHAEVRFTLERAAHIVHAMRIVWQKLDDSEDKVLRFVERVKDFVLGNSDRCCTRLAAFDFEEA